jgi:hypothetical protein
MQDMADASCLAPAQVQQECQDPSLQPNVENPRAFSVGGYPGDVVARPLLCSEVPTGIDKPRQSGQALWLVIRISPGGLQATGTFG